MTTRTITALFDGPAEARRAADALAAAGVDRGAVSLDDHPDRAGGLRLPEPDRHAYAEGLRRGGALLTAKVDDARVDEAVRVLEAAGAVDLDARAGEWRAAGWEASPAGGTGTAADELPPGEREVGRGTGRMRVYIGTTPVGEAKTDDPQDDMMGLNPSHPARHGGL